MTVNEWTLMERVRGPGQHSLTRENDYHYFKAQRNIITILELVSTVSLDRESKDNQWLGVTVKSQGIGGKVVVGAGQQFWTR